MSTTRRLGYGVIGATLAFGLSAGQAGSREAARSIPIASVAPTEVRNMADTRPVSADPAKADATLARGVLSVVVDRAKVIKLPEKTQTVVIGNPGVADISVQKNGVVILTGKSFGVTNVIALDSSGGMIGESMVSVSAPSDSTVLVQRGLERQTYSCTPICHPSVALGDSNGFFGETKGQVDQHSAFTGAK